MATLNARQGVTREDFGEKYFARKMSVDSRSDEEQSLRSSVSGSSMLDIKSQLLESSEPSEFPYAVTTPAPFLVSFSE